MSALPPYSTFRTDSKQMMFPQAISHGNILTFTPPGFRQSLNVKFPDSRLAVCERCKKNFKTRDMCRVRNTHTTAPWTTAFICLTLDDSCTDSEGKYIDKPLTVRMVQWQPYQVKSPFDPKTPVCSACKKTNRTRSFCRERHNHRQLPWCTVYVLLSALETADPSTVVADPSKPVDDTKNGPVDDVIDETTLNGDDQNVSSPVNGADEASAVETKTSDSPDGENIKPNQRRTHAKETKVDRPSDDINDIAESRTFLVKVNCQGTSIHWLDLAEFEGEPAGVSPPGIDPGYAMASQPQAGDPNQGHYYHPSMGYPTPQQHQHALKNQQQYLFHMQQQHQHHAAQYAAWQAHYGHPPPHQSPGQQSPQGNVPGGRLDGGSSPVPVATGEAALQQKRKVGDDGQGHGGSTPPSPHVLGHPPPPPGHQQHGQPPWILYQQMYQSQLPPMGHPPHYAPRAPWQTNEGGSPSHGENMGSEHQYAAPCTPEGNGEVNEQEGKRQRRS